MKKINEMLDALNAEKNADQAETLRVALEEELKSANKQAVEDAVKNLVVSAHKDANAFWDLFLADPYATGIQKLKRNVDEKKWEIVNGKRRIRFAQVDSAYQATYEGKSLARSKRYVGMIARFTDNLYRAECKALSEGGSAVVSVKYQGKDGVKIEEFDFSGASNNALQGQLQGIVKTLLPEDRKVNMVKADVRYIRDAFTAGKDQKIKTANEKQVEALILDAMAVRLAGKSYEVVSLAKCHKEKAKISNQTPAQEEKTSKIPETPEAEQTLSPAGSVQVKG